nr:MAG TPA: hypothetical protein [Caudoviricetes sp.]
MHKAKAPYLLIRSFTNHIRCSHFCSLPLYTSKKVLSIFFYKIACLDFIFIFKYHLLMFFLFVH